MLPVKTKYKIAKRLGPAVFEKTQTQKFALAEGRIKKTGKRGRREPSDYGKQLLEKQRVRYTYGLSEKQLSRYASEAITAENPGDSLHQALETRVDSIAYHAGFAKTRRSARQMASHGHLLVNGRRTTVASTHLKPGDVLEVRGGSSRSPLFSHLTSGEKDDLRRAPSWLTLDQGLLKATVASLPRYQPGMGLDYATVFEFYSR